MDWSDGTKASSQRAVKREGQERSVRQVGSPAIIRSIDTEGFKGDKGYVLLYRKYNREEDVKILGFWEGRPGYSIGEYVIQTTLHFD